MARRTPRSPGTRTGWDWLLVLVAGSAGCGHMLGPEPMPTTQVQGVVRVGRRPVGGGWVEFLPIDGTVGLLLTAELSPLGTFTADRVPVGRLGIRVVHPPVPLPCGRSFERHFVIRRTTRPVPTQSMAIDLNAEAVVHCPPGR